MGRVPGVKTDRFSGFHNRGRFLRLGAASQRDNENKVPVLISITDNNR